MPAHPPRPSRSVCAFLRPIASAWFIPSRYTRHIPSALYDHLCHTLATEGLAALELLALDACERIEYRGEQEEDGGNDQASSLWPDADPLYGAHDEVYGGAHVVGAELADEGVELGRRRADAEEERYLDEDDDEGAHSVAALATFCWRKQRLDNVQADNAECDDKVGVEDVCDSEREAEEYA